MSTPVKGRSYDIGEERWHAFTHMLGVVFIVMAGPLLLSMGSHLPHRMALWVYLLTFVFVFAASATYHFAPDGRTKRLLRRVDHIAIYFFIAGTNTPFLVHFGDQRVGTFFLTLMWLLVLFGTWYKLAAWGKYPWVSLVFYLSMGWLGIVTLYLIFPEVRWTTLWLIILGGLLYTAGVYFYRRDHKRWYHVIWHLFVLLAAISHFGAVYFQLA